MIPGKKAPVIISDYMLNNMQPGSIIYDLAAIQGGNTSASKVDKIVDYNGVKILGEANILNKFLFLLQIYTQKICIILY